MNPYVKKETHNGITSIEFFHPQSNSLPAKILGELATAITQAGEDPATIVIILRSTGEKAFCAGALLMLCGSVPSLLLAGYRVNVWVAALG
jgi:methylglutaconyl-CoA hydratase